MSAAVIASNTSIKIGTAVGITHTSTTVTNAIVYTVPANSYLKVLLASSSDLNWRSINALMPSNAVVNLVTTGSGNLSTINTANEVILPPGAVIRTSNGSAASNSMSLDGFLFINSP